MKALLAVFAAAAFAAGAQGASLQVDALAPTSDTLVRTRVAIEYSAVPAGDKTAATALLGRIDAAALAACSSKRQMSSASTKARIDKCRVQAVNRAVASVNSPDLTAAAAAQ